MKNIAKLHKCLQVVTIWDMRKSSLLTHNHNCLMGTITFEIHPITLTSPRNTLATIYKAFWFFFFSFIFLCIFFFWAYHTWAYNRENKILNYVKLLTLHFCYAGAYRCHFMIDGQQWWNDYLCFYFRIF